MNHTTLIRGLGVVAVAAFLLALGSRVSTVGAQPQPITESWDGIVCVTGVNLDGQPGDDMCNLENGKPTSWDRDSSGTVTVGDAVEMAANLWLDVTTADNPTATTPNEPFFALANSYWSGGVVAHPGGTITDGDQVGKIRFFIQSNVTSPLTNNIDLSDGQPPAHTIGASSPPKLGDYFPIYDSELAYKPTVSHKDTDVPKNGVPQTREDKYQADCKTAGANGLMDAIDCMPAPLPTYIEALGLPAHSFIGRAFGVATVALGSKTDVHFLVFDLTSLEDPHVSYVTFVIIGYPGVATDVPTSANVTDQTVITNPPYISSPVRTFGLTVGNAAALGDPDGDTVPGISGGVANRTVESTGTFNYDILFATQPDYDGDGISNLYDLCDTDPASGAAGGDTDGDGLTGTCDTNGEGNNPGAPYNTAPPWKAGQDVDGDTFLNSTDNCPNTPNGSGADVQLDTDMDGVGDACEPAAKLVKGNGSGYAGGYLDQDNICRDQFVIASAGDPAGEAGSSTSPTKQCLSAFTKATANANDWYSNPALYHVLKGSTAYDPTSTYRDSNNDGDPDWLPAVGPAYPDKDDNSDADRDGHSDACEGAKGTDALNPASKPGGPAVAGYPGVGGDCDGGGEYDAAESADNKDITNAADDTAGLDLDGDGCGDTKEATVMGYNHNNGLDFFDVPVPAKADPTPNGPRNQAVALTDVLAVLFYVGTQDIKTTPNANGVVYGTDKNADTMPDGRDYDRTLSPVPNPPWDAGPPDGAVAIPDVLVNLAQVPLNCIGSRPGAAPMDIEVIEVRLTKNGVVQDPGSTVTLTNGDLLDIQVVEHVKTGPPAVQVKETVILRNPPPGWYHCLNDAGAVIKTPTPPLKKYQKCTVEHIVQPASQWWKNPAFIDVETGWELTTSTVYTKTVNLMRVGLLGQPLPAPGAVMFDTPGPRPWPFPPSPTVGSAQPGTYSVQVCAREDPEETKLYVDTATGNNYKCESYTLTVS